MRMSTLACAALFAAVFAAPSQAGGLDEAPQVTVQFSDLNLARTEGANALLDRLTGAARFVCGYNSVEMKSVKSLERYRACYSAAMDTAVAQVGSPILAQLYGKPALLAADHGAGPQDGRVVLSRR